MCPPSLPPPQKNKTQNNIKQRAIPPIKIFSLTTIRVLSRIYVHIFIRNQKVLKKNRKIPQDRPKNTLKWPPGEDLL